MALIRFLPIIALLAACAQPMKTYQDACFEPATPRANGTQLFGGPKRAPEYDPVLTVQQQGGRTLVYCQ
ncbi:MAG: hypothetical protein CSA72_02600 [Rhodobacterales bacterium]|nr:MAG: hypothetical protein CSA72_02600 [Rhodobacterales bacterium]